MPRFRITLQLLLCLLLLTGCWSKRELDELAIVTSIGVDKVEDEYRLTLQIINPGEVAAQQITTRTAVSSYTATGRSLFEAIREMTETIPRRIYAAHIRDVVIGEETARDGITEVLDFFMRDHEFRTDFFVVVVRDMSAFDFLNTLTPMEKIPAEKLYNSLEASFQYWAATKSTKIQEIINSLLSEGRQPVMTGVSVNGQTSTGSRLENVEQIYSPAQIALKDLAVFKGDKLIGWLTGDESKGFNYITDNVRSTAEYMDCPQGGNITFEILTSDSKSTVIIQDGQPNININVKVKGLIDEVQCRQIDLSKEKTIQTLEKDLGTQIQKYMETSLKRAQQEFQSDIFGFGEQTMRSHNQYWKENKGDWPTIFTDLEVHTAVDVKLERTGKIIDSFQD
ncbi:Ger(x)C family spore germination protein [Pontibacillus salicampi]|uniref:Ger(X)C family spore germination protein n=1 Tax=Pontibacillus salicampi TaxID=1449801 RepID=A0ABV6LPZ2_9BACI